MREDKILIKRVNYKLKKWWDSIFISHKEVKIREWMESYFTYEYGVLKSKED